MVNNEWTVLIIVETNRDFNLKGLAVKANIYSYTVYLSRSPIESKSLESEA